MGPVPCPSGYVNHQGYKTMDLGWIKGINLPTLAQMALMGEDLL